MGLGAAAVQLADATVGFVLSMTVIARKKVSGVSRIIEPECTAKVFHAFADVPMSRLYFGRRQRECARTTRGDRRRERERKRGRETYR